MDVIADMVLAGPIINVCDHTNGTGQPYHIPHDWPVLDICVGCDRRNGTGRSYIFLMSGRYRIYVMDVIAQLVPAGHTIFPMIGRYQIYMMDEVAQMVPAGPIIFPMIGRYQIYMMDGVWVWDRTTGTGWSYHYILILSTNYQ